MSDVPRIGRPIPNAHLAQIDAPKLTDYALNPDHDHGKHKATVFKLALGFERPHWELLRDRILADLSLRPIAGVSDGPYPTLEVAVLVHGLQDQKVWVTTAWEIRDAVPWLVSLRVASHGAQEALHEQFPDAEPSTR